MPEGFLCSLSTDTSQGLPGEVVHPHCSLYSEMGLMLQIRLVLLMTDVV